MFKKATLITLAVVLARTIVMPPIISDNVEPAKDPNCKVKGTTVPCQQCYPTFYFKPSEGVCVPVSPYCKTWNSSGACLTCYPGYKILEDLCVVITDSMYLVDIKDPNCLKYVNNTCSECSYRFYFNPERVCTTVHPDCKTWDKVSGACLSCFDGYSLKGTSCVVAPKVVVQETKEPVKNQTFTEIPNCAEYNDTECVQCAFRFYFQNGTCERVSDLCKRWSEEDGKCTACYTGYELSEGTCLVRDPFCTIKTTEGCVQCANRYYLDLNSKCQGVNPLCKGYEPMTGHCTDCHEGYTLAEGNCQMGA